MALSILKARVLAPLKARKQSKGEAPDPIAKNDVKNYNNLHLVMKNSL